jgi:hypothetical protein
MRLPLGELALVDFIAVHISDFLFGDSLLGFATNFGKSRIINPQS